MPKNSEARLKANKKWTEANKDKQRVYQYRSYARKFIRDMATTKDLEELVTLIDNRRTEIKVEK